MQTISKIEKAEIIIKRSKFISLLIPIDEISEVSKYLEWVKKEYKGANHYCYAYKIEAFEKCSDDGEPSKTAGIPILNVLKREQLDHVLCIVVRYFGGIKLGASGLIHAYQDSTKLICQNAEKVNWKLGYHIHISFSYEKQKRIDYLLKDLNIFQKEFNEQISYIFEIDELSWNDLKNQLDDCMIQVLKKTWIRKLKN